MTVCHLVFPTRSEPLREQKPSLQFLYTPSAHYKLFNSFDLSKVIDLSKVPDMQLELGLSPSDFYLPRLSIPGTSWSTLKRTSCCQNRNVLGPKALQPQAQQEETDSVLVGQSPSKVASSPTPPTQGHTQTSTNSWRAPHHMRQATPKGGLQSQPDSCRQSDPCDSLVLIPGPKKL